MYILQNFGTFISGSNSRFNNYFVTMYNLVGIGDISIL